MDLRADCCYYVTSVMIGLISLIISQTLNCEKLGNPGGKEGNGKGSCGVYVGLFKISWRNKDAENYDESADR